MKLALGVLAAPVVAALVVEAVGRGMVTLGLREYGLLANVISVALIIAVLFGLPMLLRRAFRRR